MSCDFGTIDGDGTGVLHVQGNQLLQIGQLLNASLHLYTNSFFQSTSPSINVSAGTELIMEGTICDISEIGIYQE
jgi:hypothetical protein